MTKTAKERETYYNALEEHCKQLEESISTSAERLRLIVEEFDTPVLKSLLEPIIERLNSVIVFLEATSEDEQNPEQLIVND